MQRLHANGRVWLVGLALLGAGLIGGCSSTQQAQYDALMDENGELRSRLASAEDENGQLRQDLASAQNENAQLRGQIQDPDPYATGFEDVPGVSTRVNAYGEVVVAIAGDVLFDSGSISLKSTSKSSLDQVASVLKSQYGANTIRVEGYTDTDPIRKSKWETNERLSAERAMAVEKYLVGKGIENDRVYAAAFGPARQRSTKKESRRVEIVILASGQ
jgi:outer membrane protein OmpA-like peptidoglycan-associated protein